MKKKILITGILGYLSRTLCDFYKDSAYEIIGVDNRFLPDKVEWLVKNKIKFYNKNIFDIKDLLKDVDVIIHTAGITDVPTVKKQSTPEIDSEISKVGTEGTRYIIQNMDTKTKIVFLSTHVIFESLKDVSDEIDERFQPCPNLAYSTSKYQSEIDLLDSDKDFIILRLASVYGYNDCIRWKILPNLFSKMASQNERIRVYGDGSNIKPLIGVQDICASVKYLLDLNYKREIFNVVSEHKTVRQIAELCQKFNPTLNIEFTSDEIPNAGYYLSNKKLLGTGFKFYQNVEEEIKRMIYLWKNE